MRKFTNDDYRLIQEPSGLTVSPDQSHAVYTVRTMDIEKDAYVTHLWLADLDKMKTFQLTNGESEWNPLWLDNSHVLFASVRGSMSEKESVFFSICIYGGEAEEYMRIPTAGAQVSHVKDDLYLVRADRDLNPEDEGQEEKWVTYEEYPYKMDGCRYASRIRRTIYSWDNRKKELKQLTPDSMQTYQPYFSDDIVVTETGFYFCGNLYTKDSEEAMGIYYYDWESGEIKELYLDFCNIFALAYVDGRIWFSRYSLELSPKMASVSLWSVSEAGGDGREEAAPQWQPGFAGQLGVRLLFVKEWQAKGHLCEKKANGFEEYDTNGISVMEALPLDGEILFIGKEYNRLGEVYLMTESKELQKLSTHNDALLSSCSFSDPEPLIVENEGYKILGWVMKPVGYEEGKTYPGVLNIHGGPHGDYRDGFVYEHQRWANEGYFVFFCNPRGSIGFGLDFMNICGDMGGRDYRDIMAFTNGVLAEYPGLDPQKLAVTGQSYGGYMSNWIIGQTDLFKAAVPRMSISNWLSMYGISVEKRYGVGCLDGNIWDDTEKVWNQSPLKYARRVVTPTLFIQHENDRCCSIEQAEQMFNVLCEQGVDTKLVINRGCGHGGRSVQQLLHDIDVMIAWFDKYLRAEREKTC